VQVPAHALGAPTLTAQIVDATATSCRTSDDPAAPEGASFTLNQPLPMTLSTPGGNRYVGTIPTGSSMAGQPFEFSVEQGRLTFENTGAAQPIICDGVAALVGAPGQTIGDGSVNIGVVGSGGGGGSGGVGGWGVTAIILMVLIGASGAYVYKQRQSPPPPPQGFSKEVEAMPQFYASAPPPPPGSVPPPPPAPLPTGWQALNDPNTGAVYYYNANTGESTWARPSVV